MEFDTTSKGIGRRTCIEIIRQRIDTSRLARRHTYFRRLQHSTRISTQCNVAKRFRKQFPGRLRSSATKEYCQSPGALRVQSAEYRVQRRFLLVSSLYAVHCTLHPKPFAHSERLSRDAPFTDGHLVPIPTTNSPILSLYFYRLKFKGSLIKASTPAKA